MTRAEEIAQSLLDSIVEVHGSYRGFERNLIAALESYAKEERERCAKIAEDAKINVNTRAPFQIGYNGACSAIAARIREGGETKP